MSGVAPKKKTKKTRSSSVTGTTSTVMKKEKKKKVKGRSNSVSETAFGDLDEAAVEMSFYQLDMQPSRQRRPGVEYNEVDLRELVKLRDDFYLKLQMFYKTQAIQCIGQAHYLASTIRVQYITRGYDPRKRDDILTQREFLLAHLLTISGIKNDIKNDLTPIRAPKGAAFKKLKGLPSRMSRRSTSFRE